MNRQHAPYQLYVMDVSYYSGKMEAYIKYKEIPYQRHLVDMNVMLNDLYVHTGMMKVPVMQTPTGQWLKDTTPMIEWLEKAHPAHSISFSDPATEFMSALLEDYADEWLWRPAMYWRWRFPETRRHLGRRIAREVLHDWPLPESLTALYMAQRQTAIFLKGDGITKHTVPYVEGLYLNTLQTLSDVLTTNDFLLGDKPSLADFGFFASMFRHFSLDPAPAQIMMQDFPAVYAWVSRVWNAKGSDYQNTNLNHKQIDWSAWQPLLNDLSTNYLTSLIANATAWQQQAKKFGFSSKDVTFKKLPVIQYRVFCLEQLQQKWHALNNTEQQRILTIFANEASRKNIYEALSSTPIDSKLSEEHQLPLQPRRDKITRSEKLVRLLLGTPHDMPKTFQSDDNNES